MHFLNFFSLLVTRKPLLTAGGPPREGPDERYLMLWGRFIDAQKVLRAARNGEAQSLVPRTWQLVRRASDGREETLADAVLCYDLCPDGSIIYSDGSVIHHLTPSGERRQLCSAKLIQRAIALG
ncbi:MAG TPA: hypothetical protein VHP11_05790 [Tepidisphaeraceae bacterium]|nr:hypothetical protein [Tepidisphaeraceae bacterium]